MSKPKSFRWKLHGSELVALYWDIDHTRLSLTEIAAKHNISRTALYETYLPNRSKIEKAEKIGRYAPAAPEATAPPASAPIITAPPVLVPDQVPVRPRRRVAL